MFKHIVAFVYIILASIGCTWGQNTKGSDIDLSSKRFKKMIDRTISFTVPLISVEELNAHQDQYVIIDTRESEEYSVSHLPKAKFLSYDEPDFQVLEKVDKDTPIVFYCSIGYRSEKIAEKARAQGYTQVYNLYGSIFEWCNKGYGLVDSEDQPTNKVHGYNWMWGRWIKNEAFQKVY